MTKIEQLVHRFEYVRKQWINATTKEAEDEWFQKLVFLEDEIKKYSETLNKPRKGTSELGSEVMAKYIGFNKNGNQEG